MLWNRSNTLALATHKCVICRGSGLTLGRAGTLKACDCVLREIFKICHNRFRHCVTKEKYMSKVTLEIHSGPNRRGTWGLKQEEYVADFLKVTQRTLTPEEYTIFKYRFLLGADWKLCIRRLKMERGPFFHAVYRIQTKLGQVFSELEPYALYPVDEYFSTAHRSQSVHALLPRTNKVVPIRPPLRQVAQHVEDELKAA
jgi:hypothetical protein